MGTGDACAEGGLEPYQMTLSNHRPTRPKVMRSTLEDLNQGRDLVGHALLVDRCLHMGKDSRSDRGCDLNHGNHRLSDPHGL